ncbi:hypothetical protein [Streptomyces sp. P17]|uniref:hypothetical protein n=1 Tax=Streptomyces sp. P17 TaxID=3074716 RepID=UPI0037DCF322
MSHIEPHTDSVSVSVRIGLLGGCVPQLPVPAGPVTLAVEFRTADAPPPAEGLRPGGPDTLDFRRKP